MFQNGGCFSYVNPRMVNLLGYESADELIDKPFWEIIASGDRGMVREKDFKEMFAGYVTEGVIPRYGIPDQFLLVDSIAKTSVGKTDKKKLRMQYQATQSH